VMYSKKHVKSKSLKTVHVSAMAVFAFSVAAMTFPESCIMIAINPLFQYIQGIGCLAMWQSREDKNLLLSRQHAIGGYFTLSIAYVAMYWTMRLSNLSGGSILHIGNSFRKYIPNTDLFLGLTHPFTLSASVNAKTEGSVSNVLLKSIIEMLTCLDNITVILICIAPHCTEAIWQILTTAAGEDAKWPKLLANCMAILIVLAVTQLYNVLLKMAWKRWGGDKNQYTQNIPDNNTTVLSEDCFELTGIDEMQEDVNESNKSNSSTTAI